MRRHRERVDLQGSLDKHGADARFTIRDTADQLIDDGRSGAGERGDDLIPALLDRLTPILGDRALVAAGHRVVHGGSRFYDPVIVTSGVLAALDEITPLAPLHQPACLSPIRTLLAMRPDVTQVACFDTAFHRDLPTVYRQFPIPNLPDGIHRYGFHGLSFEYISQCMGQPHLKTIVAHLGSGASLCAVTGGKSVNTTMSLTPLDGLLMGTRCGAIDPGLLLYLQRSWKNTNELEDALYHKSGLLALSGFSSDMRELLKSDDAKAKLAIDQFCARAAEQICVMATSLGGFDRLVFTGGIGEHSFEVRQQIADRLRWLGLALDESANRKNARQICSHDSRIAVHVIPTNEELSIVKHAARIGLSTTPSAPK